MRRRALLLWLPLAGFVLLASFLVLGLRRPEGTEIASRMVGTAAPDFRLAPAAPGLPGLATADLATGRPVLVNIFASWCVPCAAEAPQLAALRGAGVTIVGIAIRDRREDVAAFLARYGSPYARIGADPLSRVQMAFGSSGVPESFVVDGRGTIRLQKIGPIASDDVPAILAAVRGAG